MAHRDISILLRNEVDFHDAKMRDQIGSMTEEELVVWAQTRIPGIVIKLEECRIDPGKVIDAGTRRADEIASIELAETYSEWTKALINTVRERRLSGDAVPNPWRDFVFDILLGVRKKPDGRGKKSQSMRDDTIAERILKINAPQAFAARGTEASHDRPCAVGIVSAALGGNPGYEGVERVWHDYLARRSASK